MRRRLGMDAHPARFFQLVVAAGRRDWRGSGGEVRARKLAVRAGSLRRSLLWGLPVFMERFSIVDANSLVVFFVLFSLFYISMGEIIANHMYLWTIVFATYGSDTGAYFIGRAFGRHKMNPRISPKKAGRAFWRCRFGSHYQHRAQLAVLEQSECDGQRAALFALSGFRGTRRSLL